jgi:hypothetical protein
MALIRAASPFAECCQITIGVAGDGVQIREQSASSTANFERIAHITAFVVLACAPVAMATQETEPLVEH